MISDSQMDKFFSDRLRDYPSSVPEDMWKRIEEKKKRDRMFWLFFFRLLAIVILTLGLRGYFIINQNKSAVNIATDSAGINHARIIPDTIKSNVSNLPTTQNQTQESQINGANKNENRKEKTRINYLDKFDHAKSSNQDNATTSKTGSTSKAQSATISSTATADSHVVKKNNAEDKNDSLHKEPLAKATVADSSRSKDLKKPKEEKKLNNRKWYLDLYVSPDYPIISPHEYEQSKLSYTLGVRINRSLGDHFSLKTGVQYSRINIMANDSFGIDRLQRLDLPVLVGYSVGNEKLKATFNGGVILNLYSWFPGSDSIVFFKTNTGLSLYLGVNFETKINEKFSLFGEPYYRYQLTSMTVSSVSNVKFIDIVGITIGARYYFKKKQSGK
jgi:hypothetical protein